MNADFLVSIDQEVSQVAVKRPHVVILGAGASRAACPKGDKNGHALPLMQNLAEVVGLRPLLEKWAIDADRNFEEIFSELHERSDFDKIADIEEAVDCYFRQLLLPDQPTIYDHLVLSLRDTDLIATFNWDPLLLHAYWRNAKSGLSQPRWALLHGNVAVGYCGKDKVSGLAGYRCRHCGEPYTGVPLLYPIKKKDYATDPYIAEEWQVLRTYLGRAFMMTIFGYRAPQEDTEAIAVMREAWGEKTQRFMEQIAFINIESDARIRKTWSAFIHTHHYERQADFYDSWIAKHPRRTGEAYVSQYVDGKFIDDNPIPRNSDLPELWKWYDRFKVAEEEACGAHALFRTKNTNGRPGSER